ncbi:MAG: hypothetical protein V4546_13105 [Bacteroidota bacterium]
MKTSNKILISFAAALILIPILGMVIVSATKYKNQPDHFEAFKDQIEDLKSFETKSQGKTSIKLNENYDQINIENGNGSSLEVKLLKDDNYGAKIADEFKDVIKFKVNNGILNISFKQGFKIDDFNNRIIIVLYAPEFKNLKAKNLFNLHIKAELNDFSMDLTDCNFNLAKGGATSTKVVNGDTTENKVFNQTLIKNLKLSLNNTKFYMSDLDLNSLDINALNNSSVFINNDEFNSKKLSINELTINTNGLADVKIKQVVVEKAKGVFSDSTKLEIPAYLLNQMYKK